MIITHTGDFEPSAWQRDINAQLSALESGLHVEYFRLLPDFFARPPATREAYGVSVRYKTPDGAAYHLSFYDDVPALDVVHHVVLALDALK